MCGRFASYRSAQDLADHYEVDEVTPAARAVAPSYNVAPTQQVRVVLDRAGPHGRTRELRAARWGLVPAWAKDARIGNKMINARQESLVDRPAFRSSLRQRRCVVPADGYYEWQRADDGGRQPFFIHDPVQPLSLAGLYAFWRDPERGDDDPERWVLSTTIITTAAKGQLAELHDRVPVVLGPEAVADWLAPDLTSSPEALGILQAPETKLAWFAVSRRVNGR